MWLLINLETEEKLLFNSVEDWQKWIEYLKWTNYTIQFIKVMRRGLESV